MKKQQILTVLGISALVGVAMMDDDSVNIPVIQQNAMGVITNHGLQFADVAFHEAFETTSGGRVCYRVREYNDKPAHREIMCVEMINNEFVLQVMR